MSEINIEEVFSNYSTFRETIGEYFGCDCVWYNVILHLEDKWTDYGDKHGEIGFDFQVDEFMYSLEIYGTSRWEKDDFVMVVGNDGCGDRDLYVFRQSNQVTEMEG